ncbi:hypothetical protein O6H91_21G064900 [Diphasiastrum complanatum]|uniref:Uncharacterized protein n=2 Tax=Diphasiastrum complanatum TaxID=34168 RepID=A0ACC2ALD2_DIPCM|nr:hypothetical protein O6H91_21G064900 [Diphasiastrum complanatum]KAJ7518343.1 hypothetical protein O6H91_21G064900 [Diphasiastrum complanatum]
MAQVFRRPESVRQQRSTDPGALPALPSPKDAESQIQGGYQEAGAAGQIVLSNGTPRSCKVDGGEARSGSVSPQTAASCLGNTSAMSQHVNQKAQAFADAHRGRVEAEAQAYLDAETRKAEARAQRLQAKAERHRMHDESKALEARKREEKRAEELVHYAEMKAGKVMSKAQKDALKIKAHANEETEKAIADAYTKAERLKAEIEEAKKKELAEIVDRVQQMIVIGELPSHEQRGVVHKMKQSLARHLIRRISYDQTLIPYF